jgi:hypothetical protein
MYINTNFKDNCLSRWAELDKASKYICHNPNSPYYLQACEGDEPYPKGCPEDVYSIECVTSISTYSVLNYDINDIMATCTIKKEKDLVTLTNVTNN